MPRKIIDAYPTITLKPELIGAHTPAQARTIGEDIVSLVLRHVAPHAQDMISVSRLGKHEVDLAIETEARCEFCNDRWTEDSPTYNGGCCDRDQAHDPERLKEISELAAAVDGEVFYRFEEGQRGRVAVDWPVTLAEAVIDWLEADRPPAGATNLLPLIKRVIDSEWCVVWSDPGPSGTSLARRPDEVQNTNTPNDLARQLQALLDDMGLGTTKPEVAA